MCDLFYTDTFIHVIPGDAEQTDKSDTWFFTLQERDDMICRSCTGLSKKMDGIWNRYNLKSTGRIYTFGVLKCSEKFKVLDLP